MSTKQYILTTVDKFTKIQCLKLLEYILELKIKTHPCGEGTNINLDAISHYKLVKIKKRVQQLDVPIDAVHRI